VSALRRQTESLACFVSFAHLFLRHGMRSKETTMTIITVSSNNRVWYLIGAIFFILVGVALAIAGFVEVGLALGITGIVVTVAAVVFLIDAIINLTS
jgi:hypothetical protein